MTITLLSDMPQTFQNKYQNLLDYKPNHIILTLPKTRYKTKAPFDCDVLTIDHLNVDLYRYGGVLVCNELGLFLGYTAYSPEQLENEFTRIMQIRMRFKEKI